MLIGIDHLVVAVNDPDAAAEALERTIGLVSTAGGRHPALGTRNRLVWLGESYLELIGLDDPAFSGPSWIRDPVVRALAHGGGLATWAIASDGLEADAARLRAVGSGLGPVAAGERARPDGTVVRWSFAAPARLGVLEPPFLIEHDPTSPEWTAADRAARATMSHPLGAPVSLIGLDLPAPPREVNAISQRWLRAIGLRFRPSLSGRGARDTDVGAQRVRLVPAVPGARPTVRLRAVGVPGGEAEILGLRFDIASALP